MGTSVDAYLHSIEEGDVRPDALRPRRTRSVAGAPSVAGGRTPRLRLDAVENEEQRWHDSDSHDGWRGVPGWQVPRVFT
jgi:hypothetical protein